MIALQLNLSDVRSSKEVLPGSNKKGSQHYFLVRRKPQTKCHQYVYEQGLATKRRPFKTVLSQVEHYFVS